MDYPVRLIGDSLEHGWVDWDGFVADDDLVSGVVPEQQLAAALQLLLAAQVGPAVGPGPGINLIEIFKNYVNKEYFNFEHFSIVFGNFVPGRIARSRNAV